MQPCERSKKHIVAFLRRFEMVFSYDVFYSRIEMRIADLNLAERSKSTSMRENRLMTDRHYLCGSHNLTPAARCENWEAMVLSETSQQEIAAFESEWRKLSGREIQKTYPDFYPDTFTVPKRPQAT